MEAAAQQAKDQRELDELVIWASARGLLADAEDLVSRGASLTTSDKLGRRPVHYAAAHGHLGMLQYLSRKGADLEAEDPEARMPLHHAAAGGKGVEALRYLTQHTTWLSAPDANDDTPLHLASRRGWVDGIKLLLARDATLDVANERGLSPLGEAVAGGHVEAAKVLLAAGADPGWRAAGYTLLHVAAGLGQADTLKLLLDHVGSSSSLVHDSKNDDNATPLHAAAIAGSTTAVQLLLSQGADAAAAGADGSLPWELVQEAPAAANGSDERPSKKQQQVHEQQQKQLRELRQMLKDAASKGRKMSVPVSSSKPKDSKASSADQAMPAAAAGVSPVEAYREQFKRLSPSEQALKVDRLAGLSAKELQEAGYLTDHAKQAITQVRRAQLLVAVYRAVMALRADEEFQEDAADPAVQAALQDMGLHDNMHKYAKQRQVVSVATKLKKFHTVMQESGGVRLGIQDLLVPPGQSAAVLNAKDAAQVEQLTAATAAARADAVAAITGQPVPDAALTSRRSVGQPVPVPAAGMGEIEPSEEGPEPEQPADTADNELDRELMRHKKAQSAAPKGAVLSVLARVRKFLNPTPEELEQMPLGQRMRFELVVSFVRAVKIFSIMMVLMFGMWCLNLLPSQSDPQLQPHMQQHIMQQEAAVQQGEPLQQAAGLQDHGEL